MKKLIIFLLLFTILFISSSQSYEQQTIVPLLEKYLPTRPLEGLLSLFKIPYWGITVSVEERGYYYFLEFLIRKAAHVVIFAAIAVAVLKLLPKPKIWLAFGIAVGIAILDEYRQSLTGGRTGLAADVVLDSFGAALGLGIWWLWKRNKANRISDE